MSLARMLQSASRVRACDRSAVSRASFFNLSGGDADMSLETSYCRSVLKLTQCGKSGTQVGLGRVVDLMAILLKVLEEVSGAQAASTRLMLLMWLRGSC
jgi:hypothetical protein